MKVLLLNGSRLPGGCLNSQASTLIRNFRLEFPDNALTENESDCLIDSSLSELFSSGEHYDLVILPYSLSPSPADRYTTSALPPNGSINRSRFSSSETRMLLMSGGAACSEPFS